MTVASVIDKFLNKHRLEDVHLVLDSTGPSLTKHYLALNAIGAERLSRFKRVHSFSGGTFAYFGYLAASRDRCRHPLPEYYRNLDRQMRRLHADGVPVLSPLVRYARTKTFYASPAPMEGVIRYVFDDAFLAQPSEAIAPTFSSYYAESGGGIVRFDGGAPTAELRTVFDVVRHAVNIPFMYGGSGKLSDPAFHPEYRRKLKQLAGEGEPTLVITPWKSGEKGSTCYLNPFGTSNQKLVMSRDILCLLMNIPNPTYGRDLQAIFG